MLKRVHRKDIVGLLVSVVALCSVVSCQGEKGRRENHVENVNANPIAAEHTHLQPLEEHAHPHPPETPKILPQSIMKNMSVISVYTFDPAKGEKGKISYELLEPARTRIVITAKDDPDQLYRVLFWDWQEAGKQVVEWDGTDQSGSALDRKECAVRTACIAKSVHQPGTRVIKPLTTEQLVQGLQGPPDHSRCDPEVCKPMKVRLAGIKQEKSDDSAASRKPAPGAALSGVVTLEVEVAKDARGYGNKTGYGVRWMVDQELVAAQYFEKESDGKFSYALDTTAFRNGEHILRVSTCDHYDHIGVTSTRVVFDNR